eukprot:758003-Hanusia_phi.AAC.5
MVEEHNRIVGVDSQDGGEMGMKRGLTASETDRWRIMLELILCQLLCGFASPEHSKGRKVLSRAANNESAELKSGR